ncbi:hypothetical protein Tco_0699871 [Tanacetum coccineum]
MEEFHKTLLTNPTWDEVQFIRYNVSKPLPLGGPPGQVTIQSDFFFNKCIWVFLIRQRVAGWQLSISKMKGTYFHELARANGTPIRCGLKKECKYDIARYIVWYLSCGSKDKRLYIDRHTSEGDAELISFFVELILKNILLRKGTSNICTLVTLMNCTYSNLQGHLDISPTRREDRFSLLFLSTYGPELGYNVQRVEDFHVWGGLKAIDAANLTKPQWDATGLSSSRRTST